MDQHDHLQHDGLALGELVAGGEVTAAELLAAARMRAREVNPAINAICTRLDDHADERAAQPLSGPFAGVPFLLVAERTSTVVQRWLDAGVVVFGKTNTPEFGSKGITEPALFGPTRNPWDLDRTPGGSSGGATSGVVSRTVRDTAAGQLRAISSTIRCASARPSGAGTSG